MNRKKYIPFTFMLFLTGIVPTYAACSNEDIYNFKKIEDTYTVKYEFVKETKDYNITFNMPQPEKYAYIMDKNINMKNFLTSTENSFTYSKIQPGKYKIEVVGTTAECKDVLKTIELNLPKYNVYSEDKICEGIEEFVLCQPTYEKEIDYDTFVSRVNTYKKTKAKQNHEKEEEKNNVVIEYIKENLTEIIIITVFVILVVITTIITAKSMRKSRRLE